MRTVSEETICYPRNWQNVKRHLTIDYGEFDTYLPHVDLIIYNSRKFAHHCRNRHARTNLKKNEFLT